MWQIRDRTLAWGERTYIMGVINVTPDSFSDGGLYTSVTSALAQAEQLAPYVDILDIGGESTRPGAEPVDGAEEINRVVPVIKAIRANYPDLPISIDTTKVAVAEAAIAAGSDIVNDVSAGRFDLEMLPFVGKYQVPIVLMHMQGQPRTMQKYPSYKNVVAEVTQFLQNGITMAIACGLPQNLIAIDPGLGFGKTLEHNLQLLRELKKLKTLKCPILVGASRKSFIGKLCNQDNPSDRLFGTAAACSVAIANGADILRVHDAKEIKDVCAVTDTIYRF
ncbi:dihydropteroate synthase [Synechococcus sp. PCC 7502]|uniref:dihydropteroate synthase n=1 Tax=Synechococcus sp. PCC 7502 TaxID=1173263 RepID=UPI00029FFD16|nr:dihydropteroate synthase [Synechococcus sp. PCC 7502]AFY74892.1 dihydropteroate synthase [Synechococcus sp. PCC 7502]